MEKQTKSFRKDTGIHGCWAWGKGPEDYYNWWDAVPKSDNKFIWNPRKIWLKDRQKFINHVKKGFTKDTPCKKVIRHLNWKYWLILDKYDGKDCEIKWSVFIDGFEDTIFNVVEDYFMKKETRQFVHYKKTRRLLKNLQKSKKKLI